MRDTLMICPCCCSLETRILDTKHAQSGTTRRHECRCGARWTSDAKVRNGSVEPPLMGVPPSANGGPPPPLMGVPPSANGGGISLFSDPGSSSVSDPDIRIPSKQIPRIHNKMRVAYSQWFEAAWSLYPRREEKAMAFAQWQYCAREIGEEELSARVVAALVWQVPLLWDGENWRFAKYFQRYLKARKWEDERPAPAPERQPVSQNGEAVRAFIAMDGGRRTR